MIEKVATGCMEIDLNEELELGQIRCEGVEVRFVSTLGKGAYCKVKKVIVKQKDQEVPYAMKIYDKHSLNSAKITENLRLSTMLSKSIHEIDCAGSLDHPNITKTFMRFGDEVYMKSKPEHISVIYFNFKTSRLYVLQSLGDLGRIAEMTGNTFEEMQFTIPDQVKQAALQQKEGHPSFCLSEHEKISQFIFADVA